MIFGSSAAAVRWRSTGVCRQSALRGFWRAQRSGRVRRSSLKNGCALFAAFVFLVCGLSGRAGAQQEPAAAAPADNAALATIYGTVVDANGALAAGARVTLSGAASRTATTGGDGEFSFTGLPAGTYSVEVTGPGMGTATAPHIVLQPGAVRFLKQIMLPVAAASTSVHVVAHSEQLAEEQVHLEIQQRVLGVLPNFYTSYNWNAQPLWAKQKFQLAVRSEFDPVSFAGAAAVAGVEQYYNRFPGYGPGPEGYAKRFGAAYANDIIGGFIGNAIAPTLLHQDPRYFYKGTGSFTSRAFYAVSQAFVCRGDNGRTEPSYSHFIGVFAAGGISNLYYPAGDRGASLAFTNGLISIASGAATNLVREFILPGLTTHAPHQARQKSLIHLF
jgi:Carboxypeptidase regulatory-like domain